MTAWIYVNTSKQVGDPEHVKVFATADAPEPIVRAVSVKGTNSF